MDTAVFPSEVREADTLAVHAVALVVAVIGAEELAAVMATVASVAHTLAVHAATVVVAVVRTSRHGAVRPCPAWVAQTLTRVMLKRTMATAACVHAC